MHAATLGQEIGVREIIIPRYPGYASAWGMLVTEPRRDFANFLAACRGYHDWVRAFDVCRPRSRRNRLFPRRPRIAGAECDF